ncbi:unnamed protein product [Paramecium pentaurelia]|uniref:Tetratricopeptide repeat protein n=1 Tax=Paramecium pentaurelia TaxID=43138 RepID=A0A8S1XR90_9CILI|nr:unnamed protein product [Paramecium pentaurelia]
MRFQEFKIFLRPKQKLIQKVNEYYQDHSNERVELGCYYMDEQKIDQALSDFSQAIDINPKYSSAFYDRAILYDNITDKALNDYNQAFELDEKNFNASHPKGFIPIKEFQVQFYRI